MLFVLGMIGVGVCLVGGAVAMGYALGWAHGHQEATSEEWDRVQRQQRRYKRCTPEPTRLRLVDYRHPVFFYDQDGPAA